MTTETVVISTLVLLLIWELWTFYNRRPNDTISEIVHGWARKRTIFPFLVGILCGHFFWPLCGVG